MQCPKCENGEVIVKKAKGRIFFGCSNYPECAYASWKNPRGDQARLVQDIDISKDLTSEFTEEETA
jgi:ssDNA-binding Zn-finger/Zn-ribbon topoisomerase 1